MREGGEFYIMLCFNPQQNILMMKLQQNNNLYLRKCNLFAKHGVYRKYKIFVMGYISINLNF